MATNEKGIPLGLELHSFFQLKRSKTTKDKDSTGVQIQLFNHFATTNDDFNEVFERELRGAKLDFLSEADRGLFRKELHDRVSVYVDRYREFSKLYPDKRNLRILKTAISFEKWLKDEPKTIDNQSKKREFSLPQIALIHMYEGGIKSRSVAKELAEHNGYVALNSGEALYQDFCKFDSPANRTGLSTESPTKIKNRIKLIESVIPDLAPSLAKRAADEVNQLNIYLESATV